MPLFRNVFVDKSVQEQLWILYSVLYQIEQKDVDVNETLKEKEPATALEEIFEKLNVFFKAPEKDFERAFYLMMSVLNALKESEQIPNLKFFINVLGQKQDSDNLEKRIELFFNIFNFFEHQDQHRVFVFENILEFLENFGEIERLTHQLEIINLWMQSCSLTKEEKQKIYLRIFEVFKDSDLSLAFDYILAYLKSGGSEAKYCRLTIQIALQRLDYFQFEALTYYQSLQTIKNEPLYQLLNIMVTGTRNQLKEFLSKNSNSLKENQLEQEVLEKKMTLFEFASFCLDHLSKFVDYKDISDHLKVPLDSIEQWVIDGVRSGLIEGKMDQLNQKFYVSRASSRSFGQKEWQTLKEKFTGLSEQLKNVRQVIEKSKTNFQKDLEGPLVEAPIH